MTASLTSASHPQRSPAITLGSHQVVWCAALAIVLALRQYLVDPSVLLTVFTDPDDALRLHQVREWMAGAGWYDLTLNRLGADAPLHSHWSRLVDAPIALLIKLFSFVMTVDDAENAARFVWPSLLLAVLTLLVAREAERISGRAGFWLTLALVAMTPLAFMQFQIGHIDHHNAMILGAIGGLLLLLRATISPESGRLAGILLGASLTVGLEPIGLIGGGLGAGVLVGALVPSARAGVRSTANWLALTLILGFVVSVPPARYLQIQCDAISLNLVLLVAVGAATVNAVDHWAGRGHIAMRVALLAGGAVAGVAAFALVEPRCLAGPFGMVDPAVRPIWLDHVTEGFSIWSVFGRQPGLVISYVVMMGTAFALALRRLTMERNARMLLEVALVIIACAYGTIYLKLIPYAMWIALFVIAKEVPRLPALLGQTARTIQLSTVLLTNQSTVFALVSAAMSLLIGIGAIKPIENKLAQTFGCDNRAGIHTLAGLPAGLVVSDFDLGPLIVIDTPHNVLAAPYHRLDHQIIESNSILSGPADQAYAKLTAIGANYAVVCGGKGQKFIDPDSLRGTLIAGRPIAGLEKISLPTAADSLIAYRVIAR